MAPKNLPPAAKQAKILDWFRETMGVYSFKELEKLLPSVGSINGMQVKDYIQNLTDENQIRVEKIGSGNWYWYFTSDTKKTKENIINNLKSEESKLKGSIAEAERQNDEEIAKRVEDDEMLGNKGMGRNALLEAHDTLLKEVEILDRELAGYSESDPTEVLRKVEETKKLKESAVRWTDNIESMESFLVKLTGDRGQVAQTMQSICGDEHVVCYMVDVEITVQAFRHNHSAQIQRHKLFKRVINDLDDPQGRGTRYNMCAYATPTAPPSTNPSTGRSLLSRLTSPLRSRSRNLADFHIRPDEPHRKYSPGDWVKGAVILSVLKPIRLTHLTVCLHGFVRVYKHAGAANEPLPVDPDLTSSSDPRKSQYFGNGHASLFQDEITLCGEGRLDAGKYEFNFELAFPGKGLPTSIDFERGSISYMITSTITRPTSLAATSSCDQKLSLIEIVDIGPMGPPKPRIISLEPIPRRMRRKKTNTIIVEKLAEGTDVGSGIDAIRTVGPLEPDDSASRRESTGTPTSPRSPEPSDIQSSASADSTVSSSTGMSFRISPAPYSSKSARDSQGTGSNVSIADKTITANVELMRSGCLPGDSLALKISIKHTKAIKSLHGIIITFYRQGRIDSAPPLSLFGDIKGKSAKKIKHEEYYPKSKTGLSGLSLMSAGSSSLFRKDLSQTFAPLIVDPTTLTAVVNASVRVPEDVFPSIVGVPGQMISFKYYLEVVIDLGGKLAGQQRHLPGVGVVAFPSSYGSPMGARPDGNSNMLAAWGGSIVDTDHIRREKSVVACVFEVVVGTIDSTRNRGRGSDSARLQNEVIEESPTTPIAVHEPIYEERENHHYQNHPYPYESYEPYDQYYEEQSGSYYTGEGYDYHYNNQAYPEYHPPAHSQIHVPPPEIQAQQGLSEKERVRQAEQRLLPSQPPGAEDGPPSLRTIFPPSGPSAPPEDQEEDLYGVDDDPALTPHVSAVGDASPPSALPPSPSAPTTPSLAQTAAYNHTKDKQELQRQRLLSEASAPPEFPPEGEQNSAEGSNATHNVPSAPHLTEEDEYGLFSIRGLPAAAVGEQEGLPRYER